MTPENESLAVTFHHCRQSFEAIIQLVPLRNDIAILSKPTWEDEASRLRLWGANIGAAQSKASTSLDFRLRDAETVRQQIHKNLSNLNEALQEALDCVEEIVNGEEPHLEDSTGISHSSSRHTSNQPSSVDHGENGESEESVNYEEDLQASFDDAVSLINSLFRMTLYIRNPSRRDQLKQRDTSAVANFEAFDVSHVENKFPRAECLLTQRLGQANTVRRANLRYWERHHKKLAYDEMTNHGTDDKTTVAPLSESVATAFHPAENHDNQDTRSHFSGTSYMSSMLGGDSVRRPSLPEEGKNGAPFQCPICCYIVTVSDQRDWMKHVFFDLQPYVCIFTSCKTPLLLYENRRDWFAHVLKNHLPRGENASPLIQIDCPLCHDSIRSLALIRRHLARHLEEVSLFSLPNSLFGEETELVDENKASDDSSIGDAVEVDTPAKDLAADNMSDLPPLEHGTSTRYQIIEPTNISDQGYTGDGGLTVGEDTPGPDDEADWFGESESTFEDLSSSTVRAPVDQRLDKPSTIPRTSRPPNDGELAAMKKFSSHARGCRTCANPVAVAIAHGQLCVNGSVYARAVRRYISSHNQILVSRFHRDVDNSLVEIEIPNELKIINELGWAIEQGLNVDLPRRHPRPERRFPSEPRERSKNNAVWDDSESDESNYAAPIERERKPYVADRAGLIPNEELEATNSAAAKDGSGQGEDSWERTVRGLEELAFPREPDENEAEWKKRIIEEAQARQALIRRPVKEGDASGIIERDDSDLDVGERPTVIPPDRAGNPVEGGVESRGHLSDESIPVGDGRRAEYTFRDPGEIKRFKQALSATDVAQRDGTLSLPESRQPHPSETVEEKLEGLRMLRALSRQEILPKSTPGPTGEMTAYDSDDSLPEEARTEMNRRLVEDHKSERVSPPAEPTDTTDRSNAWLEGQLRENDYALRFHRSGKSEIEKDDEIGGVRVGEIEDRPQRRERREFEEDLKEDKITRFFAHRVREPVPEPVDASKKLWNRTNSPISGKQAKGATDRTLDEKRRSYAEVARSMPPIDNKKMSRNQVSKNASDTLESLDGNMVDATTADTPRSPDSRKAHAWRCCNCGYRWSLGVAITRCPECMHRRDPNCQFLYGEPTPRILD